MRAMVQPPVKLSLHHNTCPGLALWPGSSLNLDPGTGGMLGSNGYVLLVPVGKGRARGGPECDSKGRSSPDIAQRDS